MRFLYFPGGFFLLSCWFMSWVYLSYITHYTTTAMIEKWEKLKWNFVKLFINSVEFSVCCLNYIYLCMYSLLCIWLPLFNQTFNNFMFNVSTRTVFNVFPSIFDIENLDKTEEKKKESRHLNIVDNICIASLAILCI